MNRWRKLFLVAIATAMAASLIPGHASGAAGRGVGNHELPSPPGQVVIASVNAKQPKVLGIYSFKRLYSMILALRNRPRAFDAGEGDAISAPDVLVIQEMSYSNLEIFQNMLNQTSQFDYQIAHAEGAVSKLLYNAETVDLVGAPVPWVDPCKTGTDGKQPRLYQYARFIEVASRVPFTVASVHLSNDYQDSGGMQCRFANAAELIRQLAGEQGASFAGGDFNFPAVKQAHECDPDERSEPTDWWNLMTGAVEGAPAFVDAAREWHRRRNISMANAWTYEKLESTMTCLGNKARRRSRIDFMFARNAVVAEAHADDPGWAWPTTPVPPDRRRFSDHRFVWGRFVLTGPGRPEAPISTQLRAGVIDVTWEPVEGATGYIIYRKKSGEAYSRLGTVDATITNYSDSRTSHGSDYQYSVAAVGANGAQGFESQAVAEVADAQGPLVIGHSPYSGATKVARTAHIYVRFGENIAPDGLHPQTIQLILKAKWAKGQDRTIWGELRASSPRLLVFDPAGQLERRRTYVVRVRAVRDRLGNPGAWRSFSFRT